MREMIGKHQDCGGKVWSTNRERAVCDRCGSSEGKLESQDEQDIRAIFEAQLGRKLGTIVASGTSEDEK